MMMALKVKGLICPCGIVVKIPEQLDVVVCSCGRELGLECGLYVEDEE